MSVMKMLELFFAVGVIAGTTAMIFTLAAKRTNKKPKYLPILTVVLFVMFLCLIAVFSFNK